jgi:hypothetical protein
MELFEKLQLNPKNPRTISRGDFVKLKESIKGFPEMLEKRPLVYDENFVVLGGNMRLRALKELVAEGFEIKDSYFQNASGWTEDQKREFVIKDNISNGEWDNDVLANEWSDLPLAEWGLDVPNLNEPIKPEVPFTEELMEQHNYIVLYFDNEIDWLNLMTQFPLYTVKALDAKEGYPRRGIGRVIRGTEFIKKIKE